MREIKFRGYNETFGWRYGDYKFTRLDEMPEIYHDGYPYVVDIDSIGQFTGLHDKNGAEIYEGDILQDKRKRKFKVTWNNDIGSWVNSPCEDSKSYPCFNIGTVKDLEIIGSIHENPELLESGE